MKCEKCNNIKDYNCIKQYGLCIECMNKIIKEKWE